jgi:ABC-type nitrate/sulfonate/bicarbonate transport system substrate-binding protein
MDEITIGMVAPAIPCFPIWVAQRNGYFAGHGIEASSLITGATDKVTSALRDNDCQIAIVTPEGVIADIARGGSLRLVAGNTNKAPLTLIGLPSIHTIEDLRGRTIGTTSLQEGTAILVQRMLAAHGLHYPGDYEFTLAGAHPQRWEALQAGTIDAGLQLVPFDYMAQEAGFSSLGAARDYVPHYAFTALAVDLGWAEPHRNVARGALLALREAVEWSRDHIDETAAIVVSEAHGDLAHARRALHDLYDDDIVPGDLRVAPEALDQVIASTRQAGLVTDDVPLSYESIVDDSFAAGQ